ncbi:hypothetical protein H5410_059088 [Solanum commersonii]|uniref:Uncharacterized protein n=1 Tax=Solanum commersonii TaxID=4109 RepID=A0A9J5W1J5_SOLCO|nr:hypothetical protein H5410_059088 [Solanum commersonii]
MQRRQNLSFGDLSLLCLLQSCLDFDGLDSDSSYACLLLCIFLFVFPYPTGCAEHKTGIKKEAYGLKNPLTLMSYVTLVMTLSTAVLSIIFDPWHEFRHTNYFDTSWHIARSCLLMLFGGTLAFFMVLTEYILVSITSAVTVTIAGVVKEAVTILVRRINLSKMGLWHGLIACVEVVIFPFLLLWYDEIHKDSTSEDETGSPLGNSATKYVILEEMEDQDHGP